MDLFIKSTAGVLLALVFYLTLSKFEKNYSLILTVFVCALILIAALSMLEPVIDFLKQLQTLGNLDDDTVKIVFKVIGIGLLAEIVGLICKDVGNDAMGKTLNVLAAVLMLRLSVPLLNQMIVLIKTVLNKI